MADKASETVLAGGEPVATENKPEPMEVAEDGDKPKPDSVEKKRARRRREAEEEEDDDDGEEVEDPVRLEELRVNPRLHLLTGPFLFRDMYNLKEIKMIINQADHMELRYFKVGGTKQKFRSKRGYVRFSFKSEEVAYWVLDNLRNLRIPRTQTVALKCYMVDKQTSHDILHQCEDRVTVIMQRMEAIGENDISHRALYFGNLPKTVTREQLQEFLPDAKLILLPMLKEMPRGYAFIEFESPEKANEILETYKGKKLDETDIVIRKIGSGKAAHMIVAKDKVRDRVRPRGGGGRGGRGGTRRRSPPRGPPRRFPQPPAWDTWGSGGMDRKRRGGGRRREMDDWGFRNNFRDRMFDEMRFGYMGRGGYDPWISSSSFSRSGY